MAPHTTYAEVPITPPPTEDYVRPRILEDFYSSKEMTSDDFNDIRHYIVKKAHENTVNPDLALFLAYHESRFNPMAVGDEHLTCGKTGKPMRSRGLWQINDCFNPEVSDSVAFDIIKSTEWAMPRIKSTPGIWSVYALWPSE